MTPERRKDADKDKKPGAPVGAELARYDGVARQLETTSEALSRQFESAQKDNPKLIFSRYLVASVISKHLGAAHPAITTSAILAGIKEGKLIERALRDLGLSRDEAHEAAAQAADQVQKATSSS